MRYYAFEDDAGWRRRVILRDDDPDDPGLGIPADLPDLSSLVLPEAALRELHNTLSKRKLFWWGDVVAQRGAISGSVALVARKHSLTDTAGLRRAVAMLYRNRRIV